MLATSSTTTIVLAAIQSAQVVLLAIIAVVSLKYSSDQRAAREQLHDASTERAIASASPAADEPPDVVIRHEFLSNKPGPGDKAS